MTADRRKRLKWLLGSLGGIVLAALIGVGVAIHWFRESWDSGRFGARFMLLLAWDKQLVSENPKKGLMTLRERDGGRTFTVSYKDYEQGLIIERDEWGNPLSPPTPTPVPAPAEVPAEPAGGP